MKECPVCTLLNSDSDFKKYIDSLLKTDAKISEVVFELTNRNYAVPSEHYLKKHKINCLKDFKAELSQPILSLVSNNKDNVTNEELNVNALNIAEHLEKYRNMNSQEKETDKINRLKEIEFLCSIVIHHQLLHGRSSTKAVIPKEDISALKQVENIIHNLPEAPIESQFMTFNFNTNCATCSAVLSEKRKQEYENRQKEK